MAKSLRATMYIDIDPNEILKKRGLGTNLEAQIRLANTVERLCDPYVPMAPGSGAHMKNLSLVEADGSKITYMGPYAHYQYVGEAMVGAYTGSAYAKSGEPKVYTGKPLTYSGGGMRGKAWDKRMMADRAKDVVRAMAKYVGGKPK